MSAHANRGSGIPAVRIAGADEVGVVAQLLAEFRDWFGNSHPPEEEMAASVARILADGDGEFLLARDERGVDVGVCQLRYRWSVWTSSPDCWLEDVFVRESTRGTGLGRALVEAAIERAAERGCARIELDTDEANDPALALYRSLGFAHDLKAERRSLLLGRRIAPPG